MQTLRVTGARDGASQMRAIAEEASALVRHDKGAYSGEHGEGWCRGEWVQGQFSPKINDTFAQIKNYLDPLNLLNLLSPRAHRQPAKKGTIRA